MATQNLFGDLALDTTVASTNTKLDAITKAEDVAHVSGDKGVPILGVRQDTETSPVSTDGDYHTLIFNEVGRLKTAGAPAIYAPIVDNITSNGDTVIADVTTVSNVVAYCTGTFSTVNCAFEGSIDGGTSWFGIQAVRTNANTIETTTGNLSAAPAYAWEMSVNAMTTVRVRATAFTSGTQVWRFILGSYATEPIPAAQVTATQPVSGTVTATVASTSIAALATVTGTTIYSNTALTNTDVTVKAGAGRVYAWDFYNPNATDVYVQFWNALIASVTVGTTPPLFSVRIPANSGRDYVSVVPVAYATGIAIAATTTAAGGTAPTTAIEARVEYI